MTPNIPPLGCPGPATESIQKPEAREQLLPEPRGALWVTEYLTISGWMSPSAKRDADHSDGRRSGVGVGILVGGVRGEE